MKLKLSKIAQYWQCPGSVTAELDPRSVDEPTPEREFGTRLHQALAARDPSGLSDEGRQLYDTLVSRAESIIASVFGCTDGVQHDREHKVAWKFNLDGTPAGMGRSGDVVVVGVIDDLVTKGDTALVLEYKTGWSVHDATINDQLHGYAALVTLERPDIQHLYGAIVHPGAGTVAKFDADARKRALEKLGQLVRMTTQLTEVRNPGPTQCRYCTARTWCPQYIQWAQDNLPLTSLPHLMKAVWDTPLAEWPVEALAAFGRAIDVVDAAFKAWNDRKEQLKELLKQKPELAEVVGYTASLEVREEITDASKCWQNFVAATKPMVKEALRRSFPAMTEAELEEAATNQLLAAFTSAIRVVKRQLASAVASVTHEPMTRAQRITNEIVRDCVVKKEIWYLNKATKSKKSR